MDKSSFSAPLELRDISITDPFWHREQELVRTEVIPYQWDALNDRIPGADPSFCMRNFRIAGRLMREKRENTAFEEPKYTFRGFNALPEEGRGPEDDKFYGFVFQDSDFSKWIEAVAYSLTTHPDEELERTADEAIDIVCAAQAENGYLDTYYIIGGMDRIFTNLQDHHELYCFGHLLEGAIAYKQATGKDKLLRAACRYADFIASKFGAEEGKLHGYPGHEIAEMALARLYELTGEARYLELAKYFIDERGKQPHIFDEQARERAEHSGERYIPNHDPNRYAYYQAARPVREQDEATGHAVRAVYLYSGMADVARLTGDDALYAACRRIWDNIVQKKLYVTGGIGSTHLGEAFTHAYDLPNDLAYSESCAAIGLAFFARRMLQISPEAEYGDVMELALYNTVLAGMALDGRSFFYVNPLEVAPEDCRSDPRKFHVKPVRQKWFGCACCPPNIARTVASLGAYAYTLRKGGGTEEGCAGAPDTLFAHLYLGGTVSCELGGRRIDLLTESGFPWNGDVRVKLHMEENGKEADEADEAGRGPFALAFRIPGWCGAFHASATHCGETWSVGEADGDTPGGIRAERRTGYLYLTADWADGDEIALDFPMEVRALQADPRVREDIGRVAFARGPITYCAEQADNGGELWGLRVCPEDLGQIKAAEGEIGGLRMTFLDVPGVRELSGEEERAGAPDGEEFCANPAGKGALYRDYRPARREAATIRLIPYFAWANRGEGAMRVWIPVEG